MIEFAKNLQQYSNGINFVLWNSGQEYSHLLILNACPVSCIRETTFPGPTTVVSCNSVNYCAYDSIEDVLAATVALVSSLEENDSRTG
ncbi:MAG: hypothetical protein LBV76_02325 [Deltaproteobacteria bacterium]|nr:hypothetical protein [Deltaproteobacteria bacterium]